MFLISPTFWINLSCFLVFSLVLLYLWMKHRYGYWKRRGVFSPPAKFPFGHMGPVARQEIQFGVYMAQMYMETRQHPCAGLFLLHKQTLLVNDLDMVKNVLVKDYQYFQGHGFKTNKGRDPLSQHLFNLEGEDWKRIRVKLTPTFTSSKMKYMFDIISACTDDMVEYVAQDTAAGNTMEVKELMAKLATDVIGSCAFGIQMNSFKHPDAEFRAMGRRVFSHGKIKSAIEILSFVAPSLITTLRLSFYFPDVTEFFTRIVPETIKYREDRNITRNDFLQLMIDMKNKEPMTGDSLSMPEITAQVFVFFLGGFETTSATASFALMELAKNRAIQDTLRAEIDREIAENEGKITYEMVNKMPYLTQVIEETLRMYPPLPFLFRFCTKDYTIPGTTSVVEKGTLVVVPILGIQRDPDIYSDPSRFDPDRFTPENIAKRNTFAQLAFGEGPRVCIASRFGMLQVKLALLKLLLHFEVSACDETDFNLVYEPKAFLLHTKGGMILRLSRRKV